MIRLSRFALILALPLCLAANTCATTGGGHVADTVVLDTQRAVIVAESNFKSLQQVALAGIRSGVITGTRKAQIIALVDEGQRYENAIVLGSNVAINVTNLAGIVAKLSALGVK